MSGARQADPENFLDGLLETFEPASVALLQSRDLLQRMDTKLLLTRDRLPDFLEGMRAAYSVVTAGASRQARYRTVYFDTANLQLLSDHLRGRRPRHKVRLRHYLDRRLSFLEIKSKDNHERTVKHRRSHAFDDARLSLEDRHWVSQILGADLGRLVPQAVVECRRICLVGREMPERLTIDLDVSLNSVGCTRRMRDVALIELKQPRVDRSSMAFVGLRNLQAREIRLSKYVCAMQGSRVAGRHDPRLRVHDEARSSPGSLELAS